MNRENGFFAICGFLLGLIFGGLIIGPKIYESRSGRAGASAAEMPPAAGAAADPAGAPAGGAPVMQAVLKQIASLKQQIEKNPQDVKALSQLGSMYMDAGKYPQAVGYFERALAITHDPEIATDLGICYKESGSPDKALATFQEIEKRNPDHWQALYDEAVVLVHMGRYAEAKAVIARLKAKRPTDPDVLKFEQQLNQMNG
ncbi:MAG TPA: tetratricopeptide repeat protein [Thermoanaerobaculia bacterium]|nr:tetratricopeptide repeat protein [Thermoanaerobaculia bacterium]